MINITNLKRLSLATVLAISAIGSISLPSSAFADGTLPSGGGAVCKGHGPCMVLKLDCKGKYTDGTDAGGTVYGKCSQTAQVKPQAKIKLAN
ncbi:MAG: hypothetical protein ABIQ51_06195 [Mesorhizobium sp.]